MTKKNKDIKDDMTKPCKNPCKRCGKMTVHREYNYVDGDYLDDGAWCKNCHDWVEDPD